MKQVDYKAQMTILITTLEDALWKIKAAQSSKSLNMERNRFRMILSKHSDSEYSCVLVILTSNFLKKKISFFSKFFFTCSRKILTFFLNTMGVASRVFDQSHLQYKVDISQQGVLCLSGGSFPSASHPLPTSSPLFPRCDAGLTPAILQGPLGLSWGQAHAGLGLWGFMPAFAPLPTWMPTPLSGEGAVSHCVFTFFIVSDSCAVVGA